MEPTPIQTPPARKNHKKIVIVVVFLALAYFAFSLLPFMGPLIMELRYPEKKSEEDFNRIMEMIKPAGERSYVYHNPEKEALNRKIDCKNLSMFQSKLPVVNPICLNLYQTTPEEINKKVADNQNEYDRVILYGEKVIWDAPVPAKGYEEDYGRVLYDSAKFNDQITVPAIMKLYGFSDLGFVNKLTPGKVYPFPALYFRLSNDEEVQKACGKDENSEFAGCALGMWASIVPNSIMGEKMSLPNQKVWRLGEGKDRGHVVYDYLWPSNCHTEQTMLHETAHLFLGAFRTHNIADTLVAPKYFNEFQADTVKIMGANLVCGDGTTTNFRDNQKKKTTLAEFNSIYPPGKMGSVWPKENQRCQMGILTEWSRFLAKGEFEVQFVKFTKELETWLKEGKKITDERGMQEFLIKLNSDNQTKTNLQYHGCFF